MHLLSSLLCVRHRLTAALVHLETNQFSLVLILFMLQNSIIFTRTNAIIIWIVRLHSQTSNSEWSILKTSGLSNRRYWITDIGGILNEVSLIILGIISMCLIDRQLLFSKMKASCLEEILYCLAEIPWLIIVDCCQVGPLDQSGFCESKHSIEANGHTLV